MDTGRRAEKRSLLGIQAFREPHDPPTFPYILCIPGGVAAVDGGGHSGRVGGLGMRPVSNLGDDANVQIFPRRRSLTLRDLKMGLTVEISDCCLLNCLRGC